MTQEEKINIAELLKDCPKGMELDCLLYDNVTFERFDVEQNRCYFKAGPADTFWTTCYGKVNGSPFGKCIIFPKGKTTWEGFHRPFRPFKDGDIVATTNGLFVGIVEVKNNKPVGAYCSIDYVKDFRINNDYVFDRLATEEEKAKLFQAIKDNGYKWNAETKTLEKLSKFKVGDRVRNKNYKDYIYDIHDITDKGYRAKEINADSPIIILFGSQEDNYELVPNKFDVINFEPFMKVLVRDNNEQFWTCDWFSFHDTKQVYPFACVGHYVSQCIPYDGNEHLLGTTDDCDEYYKNW